MACWRYASTVDIRLIPTVNDKQLDASTSVEVMQMNMAFTFTHDSKKMM